MRTYIVLLPRGLRPRRRIRVLGLAAALRALASYALAYGWAALAVEPRLTYVASLKAEDLDETAAGIAVVNGGAS